MGARVSLFVPLAQVGRANVRVNVSGRQPIVPTLLLYAANIGCGVKQVGREAVAKSVRTGSCIKVSDGAVCLIHPSDTAG